MWPLKSAVILHLRSSRQVLSYCRSRISNLVDYLLGTRTALSDCLSVGTYMDADGDGVGDFKGLLRRLDYLHGLGITTIWLMPFQPSPGKDDGYDISEYYGVDPRYGTLGDFVEFAHGCRQHGIRIIIDLVVNHTSDQHHWFLALREVRRTCRIATGMSGADKRPASAGKGMVFPGVQKSQHGPLRIPKQAPGISTASMISSPISTPPIRTCRPKS